MHNRILILIGVVQGWLLWALWKARELHAWPAVDPISERALLYVSLALPLAFYLTHNIVSISKTHRHKIIIGVGILFALLGAYSGWAEEIKVVRSKDVWLVPPVRPIDFLAAAILGFIILPLWGHFKREKSHWSYKLLFETSWRNAILTLSSVVLTGIFWVVMFAGAMLMKSIGLNLIYELIENPIFAIPVTCIIFSGLFALGLGRADMIVAVRRFWLSISAWLLPLLLIFSVMWVVALPFTGLTLLLKTHNAGFILLWFLTLSINFVNAAYQDGAVAQPYGQFLGKALEYAFITLLVLAGVAWWALKLRIEQYGWTEDRVWGVFVLFLASIYIVGYAYSVRFNRNWLVNIGNTNIFAALVMSAGLILLLSPLCDARRIAVNSQMSRLINENVTADKVDYAYFRWQAGRYGHEALKTLAGGVANKDHVLIASKAIQILEQKQQYVLNAETLTAAQVRQQIRAVPQGTVLDDALIKTIQLADQWQAKQCVEANVTCAVWMIDLNNDHLKEAVMITQLLYSLDERATFYQHLANGQYEYAGEFKLNYWTEKHTLEALLGEIALGKVNIIAPKFNDIEVNGHRIIVNSNE